ncbi:MAG: precorrin-8X methylmutase [Desulfovibrio sp.]|jgi:precorrin-8X/cobalt-precorrin-8 methylmutase
MSNKKIQLHSAQKPMEIEQSSLGIIDREVPEPRPFQGVEWEVVRRMIHTTADFELLDLVCFHPRAVEAGVQALAGGARIVTDTHMARVGIPMRRMEPLRCVVECLMTDPEVTQRAQRERTTRARAAVDMILEHDVQRADPAPRIWVIGNAPTALMRLLEHIHSGATCPALVVGMPVGFVNAAESKLLLQAQDSVPFVTIQGRKGGSALAACVVNALADVALRS